MTVADLAREAAKRYCATLPLPEWADALADTLGVPPAARGGAAMDELCAALRRTLEDQAVQHLRFPEACQQYSNPAGPSPMLQNRQDAGARICFRNQRRSVHRP
jgi:hypothetical protein